MTATCALWALQDNLALTPDEEKAIELKREFLDEHERVVWKPALSAPPKEFDLTDTELARIRAALETWRNFGVAADRRWLEPLIATVVAPEAVSEGSPIRAAVGS